MAREIDPAVEEFSADFPEHELIVYRNRAFGIECLIAVPKAKLRKLKEDGKQPPFWRHGQVMEVRHSRGKLGVSPC